MSDHGDGHDADYTTQPFTRGNDERMRRPISGSRGQTRASCRSGSRGRHSWSTGANQLKPNELFHSSSIATHEEEGRPLDEVDNYTQDAYDALQEHDLEQSYLHRLYQEQPQQQTDQQNQSEQQNEQAVGDKDTNGDEDEEEEEEGDEEFQLGGFVAEPPAGVPYYQIPDSQKILIVPMGDKAFDHSKATSEVIRRVWKRCYTKAWNSFKEVEESQKIIWFNEFRKSFTWAPEHEPAVSRCWKTTQRTRMRATMSRLRRKKPPLARPSWINEVVWADLTRLWATPQYIAKSVKGRKIRFTTSQDDPEDENAKAIGTHCSGATSHAHRAKQLKRKNDGREPNAYQIYSCSHIKEGPDGPKHVGDDGTRMAKYNINWGTVVEEVYKEQPFGPLPHDISIMYDNLAYLKTTPMDHRGRIWGVGSAASEVRQQAGRPPPRISESSAILGTQIVQAREQGIRLSQAPVSQGQPTPTPSRKTKEKATSKGSGKGKGKEKVTNTKTSPRTPPPGYVQALRDFADRQALGIPDQRTF